MNQTDLLALYDRAWASLARGARDRNSPMRIATLATAGRDGTPNARMLVLRTADRENRQLTFHTDSASRKVQEISANPNGCVVFWDPDELFQVRARVTLTIRKGTAREWSTVPPSLRMVYGGDPGPGAVIAAPSGHGGTGDPDRFAVLSARVWQIETLELGRERHLRAHFEIGGDFSGVWIAP